jgi:hypothetical protein
MSEDSENDDSSERSLSSTLILDCGGTGVREVKNNYAGPPMKSPGKAIGDSHVLRKLEIILSLSDEGGKYIGVDELFHGISRNRSIERLVLKTNDAIEPMPDIFQALVPFFEHNDKLGCIDLQCSRSWALNSLALALSACKNTPLKRINLTNTEASDETFARLFGSLSNVHSLTELCIKETRLGREGGEGLAHLLQHSDSNLHRLVIYSAQLDDERLVCLGNALTVNKTLKYLDLDMEDSISVESWQTFSQCLRNPNSALETLKFRDNNDDDDVMSEIVAAIVRALEGNSTLKTLDIAVDDCGGGPFIKEWVWELFDRVLCDKTSIAATYSSNHTLQEVNILHYFRDFRDDFEDDDSDCEGMNNFRDSLHVNTTGNKSEVARQKILERHFTGGVTDNVQFARGNTDIAQVFSSAPDSVLVHAIEWIGRDDLGYSVMNDFVRGFPRLFGNHSKMQDAADRKRKRYDDNMPSNEEVTVNDRAACGIQ